jgi:triosephosphate isomerase
MRVPIIAANWKMHLGQTQPALDFVRSLRSPLSEISGVEQVLCPPFTVLAALAEILTSTDIKLGAQAMHWEPQGAHTGEISAEMLADFCQYVIIGHSERRATQSTSEDDAAVNRKVLAALKKDLTPIICVGEALEQNERGETHAFVRGQIERGLHGLTPEQMVGCVIAYEPIWAIGTGKAATPAEANRTIGLTIRGTVAELFGESTAAALRIQYGGSVNPENIAAFMSMPDIDGALVGGASLKPTFVDLVRAAAGVGSD